MKSFLFLLTLLSALHAAPLSIEVVKNTAREIDEILVLGQQKQNVTPNDLLDDPTFLRRSYLNIIGRIPTPEEAQTFLASTDADKRSHLIETLTNSTGLKSRLFNFWADLLRLQSNEEAAGLGWHVWLRKAVETNMPYDKMVNAMLAADGHAAEDPAAGYYLRDRGMLLDNVSNTVQVFLGHQIGCAQCHDHPFDTFTQMDYYQLAAFLGGTEYRFDGAREKIREIIGGPSMPDRKAMAKMSPKQRKKALNGKGAKMKEAKDIASVFRYHNRNALSTAPNRELKLPDDYKYEDGVPGEAIPPRTIFGDKLDNVPPEKRKEAFANWVTSKENPYFTKVIANRLWAYVFGAGVVPELDNWSNSAAPLYPELMDTLESAMKVTDYDVAEFLRILYHTQLFQREASATDPVQGAAFHFSGPVLRRMSAEEIRDSFVTLSSGVVDDNVNTGMEEAWEEYVESYTFLMNSSAEELREIDKISDGAEAARRAAQAEGAKLRTAIREAKEAGNQAEMRRLFAQAKTLRDKVGKKGQRYGMDNEAYQMASAAISRRAPRADPSYSQFEMRASEVPAPARGNTLVREFGASDRETPDASHTQATVPQTLRLLNGNETALLTSKRNTFAREIAKIDSPEERLDYLFLSLYSAKPTTREKETFLPEVQTVNGTATLARAMLTSNRFLFVQ
ncbi:MAG: DUF1549 domain-containing protein [Verrucomicrobiaceae bacterium]